MFPIRIAVHDRMSSVRGCWLVLASVGEVDWKESFCGGYSPTKVGWAVSV
jgi:hypothetical protein